MQFFSEVLKKIRFEVEFLFQKDKLTILAHDNSEHSYKGTYSYGHLPSNMKIG
jgi:hypothetical protein